MTRLTRTPLVDPSSRPPADARRSGGAPSHDDAHAPLTSPIELDRRIRELLPCAIVRQLWLLLFDSEDVQLPAMIPIGDLPLRRGVADGEGLEELLIALDREFGVASYVFVLERPGGPEPTPADRDWLRHLLGAADGRPFQVRAAYLCHDDGVRRFGRETAA